MKNNIEQEQYSLKKIMGLWLLITIPMGVARFVIMPIFYDRVPFHPGLLFWGLMILGMMWQFVVSVIILKHELGSLTWEKLKKRLWLNHPIDPKTGQTNLKKYWLVIPVILYAFLMEQTGLLSFLSTGLVKLFPALEPPTYILIQSLAAPEFVGAWYLLGFVFISSLFNYLLGEELFFRGILLPKMNGVFGEFDWAVNGILFAAYHVHKAEEIPVFIIGLLFFSYLNKKYKSFYPGLLVHGVEFLPLLIMSLLVIAGKV